MDRHLTHTAGRGCYVLKWYHHKGHRFWNQSPLKTQRGGTVVDPGVRQSYRSVVGTAKTRTENRSLVLLLSGCNYMNELAEILHIYHFLPHISIEKRQVWTPRPKGLYFVQDQHYVRQRPPSWPQKQPIQSYHEILYLNLGAGVGRC